MLLLVNLEAALAQKNGRFSNENALLVHCLPVLYPGIISLGSSFQTAGFCIYFVDKLLAISSTVLSISIYVHTFSAVRCNVFRRF